MRKRPTPFAEYEGKIYVKIQATGIHPLCLLSDGWVAIVRFKGDRNTYVALDQAIEWHERELKESRGRSGNRKALKALSEIRTRSAAGDCEDSRKEATHA